MFIIEKPYVSEYLVDTIINHDWLVLENETVTTCGIEEDAFNLLSSEAAADYYIKQEFPFIYSNSENALEWVVNNLPKSNLTNYIKIFKDKAKFRELLKDKYPDFYFRTIEYLDINYVDKEEYAYPLILKPSVGYLNFGVRMIESSDKWEPYIKSLHKEIATNKSKYDENVVNSTTILIEEIIHGEGFKIDAFYDRNGVPVILNIFKHLTKDEKDMSNRLYVTSVSVMIQYLAKFTMFLSELGEMFNIKNFPLNLEVKITPSGELIPVEVNPMRFSGWCASDIAKYAWGINVYEYLEKQIHPDWNDIMEKAGKDTYYFSMIDIPKGFPKSSVNGFSFGRYLADFSNVFEARHIDFKSNPYFGMVLGSTSNEEELDMILNMETGKYVV